MGTDITTDNQSAKDLATLAAYLDGIADAENRWIIAGPGVTKLRNGVVEPESLIIVLCGVAMMDAYRRLITAGDDNPFNAAEQARQAIERSGFELDATYDTFQTSNRIALARALRFTLKPDDMTTAAISTSPADTVTLPIATPVGAYFIELAMSIERDQTREQHGTHRIRAQHLRSKLDDNAILAAVGNPHGLLESFDYWRLRTWHNRPKETSIISRVRKAAVKTTHYLAGRDIDEESSRLVSRDRTAPVIERDFGPKQDR